MKSHVTYLQGLYEAMLVCIVEYFPLLRRDCERDLSRLLSLVESRGLSFLMIDLPDAGKHFDMCLSNEQLVPFQKPGLGPFRKGSPVPRLFKGLVLLVFDDTGLLRVNPDIQAIRFLRQLFYAAKKVEVPCDDSKTFKIVQEFFETDQELRHPSLNWNGDECIADEYNIDSLQLVDCLRTRIRHGGHSHITYEDGFTESKLPASDRWNALEAIQSTADIVSSTLGWFNPYDWRAKHGPGAVADQRGAQNKFHFPSWSSKLESYFPMADFGFANFSSWAAFSAGRMVDKFFKNVEHPSKLICVPKTLKGPRLIASEPVSHQWCQQMILDFLVSRLAFTPIANSIHFSDQSKNREAARKASHTRSHVTIDLSSASDRLSCWTVERIFRNNDFLLGALFASRTRRVHNRIDKKQPKDYVLRKFSCMGSACTFPVQSYAFATMAIGTLLHVRGLQPTIRNIRKASKEVLVFGDDMIVPTDIWEVFQGVLSDLQLKVNPNKTFGVGRFRESCGLDAFDGHDVTPVYSITYPDVSRPGSIVSAVDTHNNFLMGGWDKVCSYIRSRVPAHRFPMLEVPIGSGCFGWFDYRCAGNPLLRSRWNSALQRTEYRVTRLVSRMTRLPIEDDSGLLQFFTAALRRKPHLYNGVVPIPIGVDQRSTNKLVRGWVSPN